MLALVGPPGRHASSTPVPLPEVSDSREGRINCKLRVGLPPQSYRYPHRRFAIRIVCDTATLLLLLLLLLLPILLKLLLLQSGADQQRGRWGPGPTPPSSRGPQILNKQLSGHNH